MSIYAYWMIAPCVDLYCFESRVSTRVRTTCLLWRICKTFYFVKSSLSINVCSCVNMEIESTLRLLSFTLSFNSYDQTNKCLFTWISCDPLEIILVHSVEAPVQFAMRSWRAQVRQSNLNVCATHFLSFCTCVCQQPPVNSFLFCAFSN